MKCSIYLVFVDFPGFSDSKLTLPKIIIALKLRSGHVSLAKFRWITKKVSSPNSNICGVGDI